jgi:hypothetical protein
MKSLKLVVSIAVLFSFTVIAQSSDVANEPGYVDFGDLVQFESTTGVTEVILDEDLLSILAQISTDEDPNVMAILNGLKLVKANVFEVSEENKDGLESRINSIDSRLSGTDWKRIVKTRSEDEIANVYIKHNNNKQIIGLVVTSMESSGEAAFVNIVGTIDLATIGKLGKQFNIPHLNEMKHKKEESDEK